MSNQSPDGIDRGKLEAARAAGAHDEYIAFVAEYPESRVADTLKAAISMDALGDFQSFAGSFGGALWEHGAKKAGNPDVENGERIRELFPKERWPKWMQQKYEGEAEPGDSPPDVPEHNDWVECDECGDPIDFTEASSFCKTWNDEHFRHDECVPETNAIRTIATDIEQEAGGDD